MIQMKCILMAIFLMAPVFSHADQNTSAESVGSGFGKVLGMMLFGYLVMKIANRKKGENADSGGTRKFLIGVLIFMVIFAIYYKSTRP